MGKILKYMGTADVRRLPKDSDFGGRLKTPTSEEVVFNRENNWVIDSSEAKLSTEAVDLLLESDDFEDVSNAERIPLNGFQRTFLSMRDEDVRTEGARAETADADQQATTANESDSKGDDSKSSKSKSGSK